MAEKIKLATIRASDEPDGELIDVLFDPEAEDEYSSLITSTGDYLPATARSVEEAVRIKFFDRSS